MNGLAHYLVGILITVLVVKWRASYREVRTSDYVIIVILAYVSHVFVDAVAYLTYHPSESDWSDPIYAGWHLFTYVAEFVGAVFFLKKDLRYAPGMIASVGFDLWDWSIRRGLGLDFLPEVHWTADLAQSILFEWWLPSLRNQQWALTIEIIIVSMLFVIWRRIYPSTKFAKEPRPSGMIELVSLVIVIGILRLLTLV